MRCCSFRETKPTLCFLNHVSTTFLWQLPAISDHISPPIKLSNSFHFFAISLEKICCDISPSSPALLVTSGGSHHSRDPPQLLMLSSYCEMIVSIEAAFPAVWAATGPRRPWLISCQQRRYHSPCRFGRQSKNRSFAT